MPWLTELFSAPVLARIRDAMTRRSPDELVTVASVQNQALAPTYPTCAPPASSDNAGTAL